MALFQCNFFSKVLYSSVRVNVVLPTPDSSDDFFKKKTLYPEEGQKYQTLYLLHGFSADYSDWQRFSRIETYACDKHLAVVMASADNSSYSDLPYGPKYFQYFTEELPKLVRSVFPLSDKRENNFIAGLSMGGYGSLKIALRKPENYAAAASLSGGLGSRIPEKGKQDPNRPTIPSEKYRYRIYGSDFQYYDPTTEDIFQLLRDSVAKGVELPKLYICCGTEDFTYQGSLKLKNLAEELGVDITYAEGPGVHNFDFWDPYIRRIIDWLPLKDGFVSD
jgi:putative tributyrin esterase